VYGLKCRVWRSWVRGVVAARRGKPFAKHSRAKKAIRTTPNVSTKSHNDTWTQIRTKFIPKYPEIVVNGANTSVTKARSITPSLVFAPMVLKISVLVFCDEASICSIVWIMVMQWSSTSPK